MMKGRLDAMIDLAIEIFLRYIVYCYGVMCELLII